MILHSLKMYEEQGEGQAAIGVVVFGRRRKSKKGWERGDLSEINMGALLRIKLIVRLIQDGIK